MIRALLVAAVLATGCAKSALPPKPVPPPESLESRKTNCFLLNQHMIDLATADYIKDSGEHPSKDEVEGIRQEVTSFLDERGALRRTTFLCLSTFTLEQLQCAASAPSLDAANACVSDE